MQVDSSLGIDKSVCRQYSLRTPELLCGVLRGQFPRYRDQKLQEEGIRSVIWTLLFNVVEGFMSFAILRGMGNEMDAAIATCRRIRPPG